MFWSTLGKEILSFMRQMRRSLLAFWDQSDKINEAKAVFKQFLILDIQTNIFDANFQIHFSTVKFDSLDNSILSLQDNNSKDSKIDNQIMKTNSHGPSFNLFQLEGIRLIAFNYSSNDW